MKFKTEASALSKLTTVKIVRPDVVQEHFDHLKGIKFSKLSKQEDLQVHVIIGIGGHRQAKDQQYDMGGPFWTNMP